MTRLRGQLFCEVFFIHNLNLAILNFKLIPTGKITLPPFKEASFRGAFGRTFRKLICAFPQKTRCYDCLLFDKCAFSVVFSPGAKASDQVFAKHEAIPRPFSLHIPGHRLVYDHGRELTVKITLFGRAIEYFPYIFLTIKEVGEEGFGLRDEKGQRGKYLIGQICEEIPERENRVIYAHSLPAENIPLAGFSLGGVIKDISPLRECTVHFASPLRLRKKGRLVQFVDFSLLLEAILRRLNSLGYFYGGGEIIQNHRELSALADRVSVSRCNTKFVDYKWRSGRQRTTMRLGGLKGEMKYCGDIGPFYPYLNAAEYIGVGKNITFGFGRIKIEV
jgi:CRISPR-associated endoribonuclease Cas6